MIWLSWLCTCFVIKGFLVQTLLGTKLELSFCLILFGHGNEEA